MSNLKEILSQLKSADDGDRRTAILELVRSRDPMSVPILSKLAEDDPSVDVRYYARKALSSLKSEITETPPPSSSHLASTIREMLASSDPGVRMAALSRVMETPAPEVIDLVRIGLEREENSNLKASFVITLGRLGNENDVERLGKCLQGSENRVRANAVEALATIGSESAFRRIVPLIQDSDHRVKVNAIKALQTYGTNSLLELLSRMAKDDSVWMRDASLYALVQIGDYRAIEIIARMAREDSLSRLREKARQAIFTLISQGNESARSFQDKLQDIDAPADSSPASKKNLEERYAFLKDPKSIRRRIGLLKISDTLSMADGPGLVQALKIETDPYLVSMILSLLRQSSFKDAVPAVIPFLESGEARIRANAVETIGVLDARGASAHLRSRLVDPNNRVRANAIFALSPLYDFDPIPCLNSLAEDPREVFRRSALYVISSVRRPEFVFFVEKLLDDPNSKIRDLAFSALEEYVKAGIAGASKIRERIGSRIHIELNREHFFENQFDKLFAGLVGTTKPESPGPSQKSREGMDPEPASGVAENLKSPESPEISGNGTLGIAQLVKSQKEHSAFIVLGEKLSNESVLPQEIICELRKMDEEKNLLQQELDFCTNIPSHEVRLDASKSEIMSEINSLSDSEIIRIEMQKLKSRRDTLLAEAGENFLQNISRLSPEIKEKVSGEIQDALKLRPFHIPPSDTSVLPRSDAGISEIFDLTLKIYQKHVLAFSIVALTLVSMFFTYLVTGMVIIVISREFAKVWSVFLGGLVIFGGVVLFLLLAGSLKFLITSMMLHFIKGEPPPYSQLVATLFSNKGFIFLQVRKLLYLFLWSILGIFHAVMGGFVAKGISRALFGKFAFEKAFIELGAVLGFAIVTFRPYIGYLLAEAIAAINPSDASIDPLDESRRLAFQNIGRLFGLFIMASILTGAITSSTVELISILGVIPGTNAFLGVVTIVSEVCLYPLAYSTIVIYTIMLCREKGSGIRS